MKTEFDKLITAWVTRGDNGYQGTIGVGDAAGARAKQFNNLLQNNLQIRVEGDSIVIGVKRTDVTDKLKMNLVRPWVQISSGMTMFPIPDGPPSTSLRRGQSVAWLAR